MTETLDWILEHQLESLGMLAILVMAIKVAFGRD